MEYFSSFIQDGKILFDINLVDASGGNGDDGDDGDDGCYNIISNIPSEIIEVAHNNYFEDIHKLDHTNNSVINAFLENLCSKVSKQNNVEFFFWPNQSTGRMFETEDFFDKINSFSFEKDIIPNNLYSINQNTEVFYFISKEFSYGRIFAKEEFNVEVKSIDRIKFQNLLPPEFGETYFNSFYDKRNFYFHFSNYNLEYLMLTDRLYYPLMFIMNKSNESTTKPKNNPTGR
jgi:hypothetical protein